MNEFEYFDDEPSEYLRHCWIAVSTHMDKERALWFAFKGQQYLDNQIIDATNDRDMWDELFRKGMGYQIAAIAYVWNGWYKEAAAIEEHFMSPPYWLPFKEHIGHYMVMLIAKKQTAHLQRIFSDPQFKYAFLPWWEAFMSLLIDDTTTITRMDDTFPILNQAINAGRQYGDNA